MGLAFEARGLRPAQYAWLLAFLPLARLLSPPLWGSLADTRFGASALLRINTWIAALAMVSLVFVRGLYPTAVVFAVWAFFNSSLVPLVEAGTYQLLGENPAGFGYIRVFGSIGFAVSALALGACSLDAAMRVPFMVAALGYLLAAVFSHRLANYRGQARVPIRSALVGLLRRADVALLWLASLLYYAAHGVFDMYFGPFARTLPNVRSELVSMAWGLGVVCEIVVLLFVPRMLTGRLMPWLLPGCALIAAVRWMLTAHVTSAVHLLLLQPLHAVTFGIWYLAFVHENQAHAPAQLRATVQGIGAASLGLGTMSATLLGGYGLERLGGRVLFQIASGVACAAMLLFLLRVTMRTTERSNQAHAAP
jgi:MFS transporter, PPP family, 3-phenylpropionic acid transporter